jgi:anti-sigma factor RsiW
MSPPCHVSGLELSRYRDGELPTANLAELGKHVEECEACQLRLADSAVLSRLLSEQFLQSEHALPPGFTAGVMARLPQPRPTLVASLRAWLPRRRALSFGLIGVAAAAAALAIVFAPSLRNPDDHLQETTESEAQIHSIEVTSPDRSAIVFESAEGNTVIWMVPSAEEDVGPANPSEP